MLVGPFVERAFGMIEASEYNKCVRCGLCLPTCPTYLETMTETSGPRGRISLIRAVDQGALDLLSPGFVHQMSECLDCRACSAVCPSGVQYGTLVEGARARIEEAKAPRRGFPANAGRWLIFNLLFGHLWVMRLVAFLVRVAQQTGLDAIGGRLAAMAPRIDRRFFVARGQRFSANAARTTVMLHAGCVMQVAFAGWQAATVRVLQRNGCNVVVPSDQGCCGAIAEHAGEPDIARSFAKRNIASFERSDAQWYIVNAAGCGAALKEYGHLLKDDPQWRDRAAAFSAKVRDVLEFLDQIGIETPTQPIAAAVTYQDACHLAHAQRVTSAPRRLLAKIPGITLREMNESSVCCGSAGIYNITQPEMSERLGHRKVENAIATQAQIIATANPGCAMQMQAHLRREGSTMRVQHVIELLDAAYGNAA